MRIRNVLLDMVHQSFEQCPYLRHAIRPPFFSGLNECIAEVSWRRRQTQQRHHLATAYGSWRNGEPEIDREYIRVAGAQVSPPLRQPVRTVAHASSFGEDTFDQCLGSLLQLVWQGLCPSSVKGFLGSIIGAVA